MSELIGKTIGQYQIVEQIGMGGMATIFKAYQPSIERYVAIKILPRQFAADPNFVKRFEQEARAIAGLEHPHIVPVHDFGTDDGYTYMVMRYVEGGTLTNLMGKNLSYERIVQIVRSIARALDYAHARGVVHRDIKPSNILIDQHGEALLTDFGIAKMVEGANITKLTSDGSILGTPAYMAPEQAAGKKVDGRTDIYSLGVVLYELLTGRPPYQAETPLAVVLKHLHDPLPPPRSIKPDIPEPLERIVLKAMAKDPGQRFQTAGEMEQALKQALREIERVAPTAQLTGPAARTARVAPPPVTANPKSRALPTMLIIGGVLAALLCVVGGGLFVWAVANAPDAGTGNQTPTVSGAVQANLPGLEETEELPNAPESSPSPTPTPLPDSSDSLAGIPPVDSTVLLSDDFSDNQNGWFTGQNNDEYGDYQAELVGGRYRLGQTAKQGVFTWEEPAEASFDDFVLSVDVQPVEQSTAFAYGVIFRVSPNDDFYAFEVDTDGFFFVNLYQNGQWQTLVEGTPTDALNDDGPNRLTVKAVGPTISFFINDTEATTIKDDTLTSGSIGVAFELYKAGDYAVVEFDNLVVRGVDAGELGEKSPPSVDEEGLLFADYFDSDASGWATGQFEDELSRYEINIEDGVYRLSATAKEPVYIEKTIPDREFSDFVLTVEATPGDAEEHYSYGVAIREDESSLYTYAFEIGNDRLYSVRLYDGEWKRLKDWSSSDAIRVGETNALMVRAEGDTMTFFVNGQQLTVIQDDTLSSGTVGLILQLFDAGKSATVEFDNLVIVALE